MGINRAKVQIYYASQRSNHVICVHVLGIYFGNSIDELEFNGKYNFYILSYFFWNHIDLSTNFAYEYPLKELLENY